VKPASALRCAVRPPSPEVAASVAESDLVTLVGPEEPAPVRLEQHGERWLLIDDQHGNGSDAPVLLALAPDELYCARAALEHYSLYSLPMRMAKRAAAQMPHALELRLLSCASVVDPASAQIGTFSQVKIDNGAYQVRPDEAVCVSVRNRSPFRMYVALFDATASGEVQQLGDESIEPGQVHVFWQDSELGTPFKMTIDNGGARARDRLVAIGRTSADYTLTYLHNEATFAKVIAECKLLQGLAPKGMLRRDLVIGRSAAATERWTAVEAVIEITA
jgi:hypothetical protein